MVSGVYPCMAWKSAECSLSIGSRSAPWSRATCITKAPAATRTSFVAIQTLNPRLQAAMVASRAAAPLTAITTVSTCGSITASMRTAGPSTKTAEVFALGKRRACSPRRAERRLATKCTTLMCGSPIRSMTSSVCVPIEPVEPRMATDLRMPIILQGEIKES